MMIWKMNNLINNINKLDDPLKRLVTNDTLLDKIVAKSRY